MKFNEISVIICTYNGSKRINAVLDALIHQHLTEKMSIEVIVVDNASTDSTAESVNNFWKTQNTKISLRIVSEPNPGKANALIKGYNEAKYELMLLCDDDNRLQPEYIKTVFEIYNNHPDIGLLGGYGKAFFDEYEKPQWFDKWEHCYVCGKHHKQNGFLKPLDFSIWGAGSVLRKTMWVFLQKSGFSFNNSIKAGKAIAEDAELSMAISFTSHRLYFDERLWFIHDLSGGRINWDNLIKQQANNGKGNAILYIYRLVLDNLSKPNPMISYLVIKKILGLCLKLFRSFMKPGNRPRWVFFYHILWELLSKRRKYTELAMESFKWIRKVKDAEPLSIKENTE